MTACPIFLRRRISFAVGTIFLAVNLSVALDAQTAETKTRTMLEEKRAARRSAYSSFKVGDTTAAIATLTATAQKWPASSPLDIEVGRQLADLSFAFHNEGNLVLATNLAALSLTRLAPAESVMASKDAARILTLAAGIYEYIQGDITRARQAYSRALVLDPNAALAKQRLSHLAAIEDAASAKAAANQMLAQRRATKGGR